MKLNYKEINNEPKIPFFKRNRTSLLWIASILIIALFGLFGYGVAVFPTAILPVKIFVVAVVAIIAIFIITSLIIIHELLDA